MWELPTNYLHRSNAGIPQGSVLGPLLVTVYINDMAEGLTSKLTPFADHNLLLCFSNCQILNSQILNGDLEKLEAGAQQWIVSFSVLKTSCMLGNYRNITPPNDLRIFNQNIACSKLLGVTSTKWDTHLVEISNKANKRLDICNSLCLKLSRRKFSILPLSDASLNIQTRFFSNSTNANSELFDKIKKRA